MEPPLHHQHHHHHQADQESGNNNNNNNNKTGSGGYTCRQTSTRWTPTTEQIRILKEIYYNNGVRSPTADQIQKISARLRQFGKIEGKNVFYWFQNHKARERQKKRFNGTATMMMTTNTPTSSSSSPNSVMMVNDHYHHQILHHHHGHHGHHGHGVTMQRHASHVNVKFDQENHMVHQNRSYPSFNNGNLNHASSGTDCGVVNASNGYMSSHIYGSMEQDYSMNYNNNVNGAYNFFDRSKPLFGLAGYNQQEDQYGGDAYVEHRRTLPLFPMHGEDGHINGGGGGSGGANGKYGQSDDVIDHYASLKLCLN